MGEGDARLQAREEEAEGGGGGPLRRAGEEEPARRPDTSHSLRAPGLQLLACSAAALRGLHLPTACLSWGRTLLGHRQWNEADCPRETFVNSKTAWEGSRIFCSLISMKQNSLRLQPTQTLASARRTTPPSMPHTDAHPLLPDPSQTRYYSSQECGPCEMLGHAVLSPSSMLRERSEREEKGKDHFSPQSLGLDGLHHL